MKLKRIKFLTGNQNLLLIIFSILILSIFNISFDAKKFKGAKGVSGNFLIFNNLETSNYLLSEKITKNLENSAHQIIKKIIANRAHTLSLEDCKFLKKSDLITKINLNVEKNFNTFSVFYQISPVEDVIKCKESIYEIINSRLKTIIDSELTKIKNEVRYIERFEIRELKKYSNELVRIETLEKNMFEIRDNEYNDQKTTFSERIQIDQILFQLNNRKVELHNIIEILSGKEDVGFIDEKFFKLIEKKNKLTSTIEILSDKNNIISEEFSNIQNSETRIINFKFVGNVLIIILITFVYLIMIFIKNKKII